MKKIRFTILILGVLIMLGSCSNGETNSNNNNEETVNREIKAFTSDGEELEVISKNELLEKNKVSSEEHLKSNNLSQRVEQLNEKKFKLIVENNQNEPQTLTFSTSQRYDFDILNEQNEVIYRFSERKSFLDVIEEVTLEPGEEISFDIEIPELEPGEYILSIRMTQNATPTPILVPFVIKSEF